MAVPAAGATTATGPPSPPPTPCRRHRHHAGGGEDGVRGGAAAGVTTATGRITTATTAAGKGAGREAGAPAPVGARRRRPSTPTTSDPPPTTAASRPSLRLTSSVSTAVTALGFACFAAGAPRNVGENVSTSPLPRGVFSFPSPADCETESGARFDLLRWKAAGGEKVITSELRFAFSSAWTRLASSGTTVNMSSPGTMNVVVVSLRCANAGCC